MTLTLLHRKIFEVGDLTILTFCNCVLKNGVIRWPLKLYVRFYVFNVFFKIQKTWLFTFSWVVAHVFSNAGGCSALHQRITQPTSWPHVASPTWSSTEQVARPVTKRFHPSDWRPPESCCRPWTWWCNDATTLAGYATTMMIMMLHV